MGTFIITIILLAIAFNFIVDLWDRYKGNTPRKQREEKKSITDLLKQLNKESIDSNSNSNSNSDSDDEFVNNYICKQELIDKKHVYLKTEIWNSLRKSILQRDNYKCQKCFKKGNILHVHHQTYKNLFKEKKEDLISLCTICHQNIHDKLGYDYDTDYYIIK